MSDEKIDLAEFFGECRTPCKSWHMLAHDDLAALVRTVRAVRAFCADPTVEASIAMHDSLAAFTDSAEGRSDAD